jgi:hypothetical protein
LGVKRKGGEGKKGRRGRKERGVALMVVMVKWCV